MPRAPSLLALVSIAASGCLALTPLEGLVGSANDAGLDGPGEGGRDAGADAPATDAASDAPLPQGGFVQKAQWSNGSPYKCTLPAPATAGNLIVALTISSPPDATVTVSDTLSQNWKSTALGACSQENLGLRVFYAENALGGSEVVTMKVGGGTLYGLALIEYSGFAALDGEASKCAAGVATMMTTPTIATTSAALLLSFFTTLSPTGAFTPGAGWTLRDNNAGFYMWEDRIVGASGSYRGEASQANNTTWTSLIVAFRSK